MMISRKAADGISRQILILKSVYQSPNSDASILWKCGEKEGDEYFTCHDSTLIRTVPATKACNASEGTVKVSQVRFQEMN